MIERPVQLFYSHRIFFTEDVFSLTNNTLLRALRRSDDGVERQRRVLVVVEDAVVYGQPGLVEKITQWFAGVEAEFKLAVAPVVMHGGEPCKNHWPHVEMLWGAIHDAGIDRHSFVIAVGGGALLDLVGFAAATAHRGVRHLRLPTTTLSQADGGVGVKNGVNYFGKKNWTGCFAVPWAVVNDFGFLHSLPAAVLREGIIEVIKVALIRDAEFFHEMEKNASALQALDIVFLQRVIRRGAELHIAHICTGGDPFELGSARPLDFGHWVAHKLEPMTGFRLSHGRAVAIGMAVDLLYAQLAGLMRPHDTTRILGLIERAGFSLWVDELSEVDDAGNLQILRGLEDFREHLGGELTITLVTAPGAACEVHQMDTVLVRQAIQLLQHRHDAAQSSVSPSGEAD